MYSVSGTRVSVSRCQLSPNELPQNETGRAAHQDVQAKTDWHVSSLQAADSPLLLSRQELCHRTMYGALLSKHPTEVGRTAATDANQKGERNAAANDVYVPRGSGRSSTKCTRSQCGATASIRPAGNDLDAGKPAANPSVSHYEWTNGAIAHVGLAQPATPRHDGCQ